MGKRVRLRTQEFERLASRANLGNKSNQAEAIGTTPSSHSRILAGTREPSAAYVMGVLSLFPGTAPDALFEVVDDDEEGTS